MTRTTSRLIDVTWPLSPRTPVWPGDAPVQIHQARDVVMVSELRMSSHAGTHLDAPAHFVPDGLTVDRVPLDLLVGPAWVAEIAGEPVVTAKLLDLAGIPEGVERLLIKTRNSARVSPPTLEGQDQIPFDEAFVGLDSSAGEWLLEGRFRLVGVDGPSIDRYDSRDFPVHRLVLETGMVVVENLRLQRVEAGAYRLICLPLPYEGGDGAPVRAVLESIA